MRNHSHSTPTRRTGKRPDGGEPERVKPLPIDQVSAEGKREHGEKKKCHILQKGPRKGGERGGGWHFSLTLTLMVGGAGGGSGTLSGWSCLTATI